MSSYNISIIQYYDIPIMIQSIHTDICIGYNQLLDKKTHIFLSSIDINHLDIELCDRPGLETLHYIMDKCHKSKIVFHTSENINMNIAKELSYLYPEKASAIRKAVLMKRDVLSILNDICKELS